MKTVPDYTTTQMRFWKIRAIRKLGGKCCRCGFSDYRALQFDHPNGGGSSQNFNTRRGRTHTYYYRIYCGEEKVQLLCANCNWILKYERSEATRTDTNEFFLKAMKEDGIGTEQQQDTGEQPESDALVA
jgi:hypothetical protein